MSETLDELRRRGVEIDQTDNRSAEEIMAFLDSLATSRAGVEMVGVPESDESAII